MTCTRRTSLQAGFALFTPGAILESEAKAETPMYGLISELTAVAGKRDELASVLVGGTSKMRGCVSYVVAADPTKPDALWITEVWIDNASHAASISLPAVQDAMVKGRPLIAGFARRVETTPLGGVGLQS